MDSKCLESFLIPEEIATEGIAGKVVGTIGAILAGYAIIILGISASIRKEDQKKTMMYMSSTNLKSKDEAKENVNKVRNEISNFILSDFKKLQSNEKYMHTLRTSIAKKLNTKIDQIPLKFKSSIEDYGDDILVRFMSNDEMHGMYNKAYNSKLINEDELSPEEFGDWINNTIGPTLNKIIIAIKSKYSGPELNNKLIKLDTSDHWEECGIYVSK